MGVETTLKTLNDLIETCQDGEYGFRSSAEHMRDGGVRQLFARRADECASAAAELRAMVVEYGGKPETGGSALGAVHRGWVALKGTLSGYTDARILEDTERGEDMAIERYMKALQATLPADVRVVVERQYLGAQRNHEQVRMLRHQARMAKV
jgi:uncharacterized protein (TIGR02284 family)